MESLEQDWITKGILDFEYKKYILLAYLKRVQENFDGLKLYPFLTDLAFHYKNLKALKENKTLIYKQFPEEISKAKFKELKLQYRKLVKDDELMEIIEAILSFAVPRMEDLIQTGKDIYENIEGSLSIQSIGISPLYANEGYVFINQTYSKDAHIFQYKVTVFESADETYRGINTMYIANFQKGIGKTFEQMKLELVRSREDMPNPATFLINVDVVCPFDETVMPIAKRLLVRHIAQNAA